jgi:hypothetical protein
LDEFLHISDWPIELKSVESFWTWHPEYGNWDWSFWVIFDIRILYAQLLPEYGNGYGPRTVGHRLYLWTGAKPRSHMADWGVLQSWPFKYQLFQYWNNSICERFFIP